MEILAPAGNKESFLAAINAGADAVYLGLTNFSARSGIDNFNYEELEWIVNYSAVFGVKIYVTVNTLIKNEELNDYFNAIEKAYLIGVDAFIVQDIFLGKILKEKFPNIVLHLSTQAGISNPTAVDEIISAGFTRVVLARETTLEDIQEISSKIETEVFIQGALCSSYSGHCYFSSFVGGNSGNRGLCKQPCRKKYTLSSNGQVKKQGFLLSLSDLCVGEKIKKLKELGVYSFKIEGRRRRPEYVYSAVKFYKAILENKNTSVEYSHLKRTFNRGNYTLGLAFGQDGAFISDKIQGHIGETIGVIESVNDKLATVKINGNYTPNNSDAYKILAKSGYEKGSAIFNKFDNKLLKVFYKGNISKGDYVNLTTDSSLTEKVSCLSKKQPIKIIATFTSGKNAKITATLNGKTITVFSDDVLEKANNLSLTESEVITCFNKTDILPFLPNITVNIEGNPFIPKSKLNALRRKFYTTLFEIEKPKKVIKTLTKTSQIISNKIEENLVIISDDFTNINAFNAIFVLFPNDYNSEEEYIKFFNQADKNNAKKYLFIPAYFNSADEQILKDVAKKVDGVYVDSYQGIAFAKKYGYNYFCGEGVNVINDIDATLVNSPFVVSKELSLKEVKNITKKFDNSFVFCLGKIPLMDLVYCPLGKDCKNCFADTKLALIDDSNRTFYLRRYKLSTCRFNLYNAFDLVFVDNSLHNKVVNLVGVNVEDKQKLLGNLSNIEALKQILTNYTSGHFNKGIL